MSRPHRIALALLLSLPAFACAQQPQQTSPPLTQRSPSDANAAAGEGRIQLNVVVTDSKGKPVAGLTQQDFTLLDDKQPRPILSFYAHDGSSQKPEPSVKVILLLDTVNIDFHQVAFEREEMAKFFQQNGGHLAQPLSIYMFTNDGVSRQEQASADGKAEAAELDSIDSKLRTIHDSAGVYGAIERFNLSLRAMYVVVDAEAKVPGRKLLMWFGPGWPMLSGIGFGNPSPKQQQANFDLIVALSTRLREAHVAVYDVTAGEPNGSTLYYEGFLKGVKTPSQEQNGNLDVKVLAVQSGGRVLGPDNDLTAQIDSCIKDTSAYYALSFDPPRADKKDEYHDVKVQVDKPKMTAHTTTGYYNQP